jgi:hypothetical protein
MKQTAVEWLEDCLTEQYPNGKFVWNTRADIEALFKRAKEMEKQQIGYSEEDIKNAFFPKFTYNKAKNKWFNEFKNK